ncbi:4Fe-4S binding protein [Noviherbaspirillum agri]
MPLDNAAGAALGRVLDSGALPVASQLCRREVGQYLDALDGNDKLVVACTQEQALFSELADRKQAVAPLRFVNIRETGGWGAEAREALPKIAALLAAAALPEPEPVPEIEYESAGRVLVIGPSALALPWAQRLHAMAGELDLSVLLTSGHGGEPLLDRPYPSYSGSHVRVQGWLGEFKVTWRQSNPIDLELCTRCNACLQACPEGAIDLSYQINLEACRAHRDCVAACGPVRAIDFARSDAERGGDFDLVLDLSEQPLLRQHQLPHGYFAPGSSEAKQAEQALALAGMVGRFGKPKYFQYKEKICAHGRNRKTGCTACVDICSAEAISSIGDHVRVDPHLCAGCGACTTVCPSGAMSYAYPRTPDMGSRLRAMLSAYRQAGGRNPAFLLHDGKRGAELVNQLGRLAGAGGARGVPARVMPLGLHHVASCGIDVWLSAIAYGASNILILTTGDEAPQYLDALLQQIGFAQVILSGLGYAGTHIELLRVENALELDTELARITPAQAPEQHATFHILPDKRTTLDFAFEHLFRHAPTSQEEIALPAGAPFGTLAVDRDACTLCMSCVGACPEAALNANPASPQLRFIERNCVQCGLCAATCPEQAITLVPRLAMDDAVRKPVVLNETEPFHCIRCNKPFGTVKMMENMLGRLASHGAFAGNLDRLRMCGDCRVADMMLAGQVMSVTSVSRPRDV